MNKTVMIKNERLDTHKIRVCILDVLQTTVNGYTSLHRQLVAAYPTDCMHINIEGMRGHVHALKRAGLVTVERNGYNTFIAAVHGLKYAPSVDETVPDDSRYGVDGIYRIKDRPARLESRPLARKETRLYSGISTLTVNV